MSVRVRMAPSPTGLPAHRRRAHVPLQLALRARARGGECLLRIENTDTSREVAEATEQIQRSLQWLGIDWDGPVTFQLDAMERCRELAAAAARRGQGVRGRGRDPLPDARRGRDRAGTTPCSGGSRCRTTELEDVVIVRSRRPADLQLREPGRGHGRRDHARDPRPGPHLEHAEAAADPRRARARAAGLRARARRARRRRQEALEAARGDVGRRVPRRPATSPRR